MDADKLPEMLIDRAEQLRKEVDFLRAGATSRASCDIAVYEVIGHLEQAIATYIAVAYFIDSKD